MADCQQCGAEEVRKRRKCDHCALRVCYRWRRCKQAEGRGHLEFRCRPRTKPLRGDRRYKRVS